MTSDGTSMYPFFVLPERNITVEESKANQNITLLYVLQDCNRHYTVRVGGVQLQVDEQYTKICVYNLSTSAHLDLSDVASMVTLSLNPSVEVNKTEDRVVKVVFEVTSLNISVSSYLSVTETQSDSSNNCSTVNGKNGTEAPEYNTSASRSGVVKHISHYSIILSACFPTLLYFVF